MNELPEVHPRRREALVGLAATLCLAPLANAAQAVEPPGAQRRPWPPRQATPSLSLPAWDGPDWSLAEARGHVVLLNFWASWCEPCLAEMPSLERLAERRAGDGLRVVAVNHRETDGAVQRFLGRMPLKLPILRDRDGAAAKAFGVRIFPSTVVVSRQGRAAFTVIGELDWTGDAASRWLAELA